MTVSPEGKIEAVANLDHTIDIVDIATSTILGEPLRGHTDIIRSLVFSPDCMTLASAGNDMVVILWDIATQQLLGKPFKAHGSVVVSLAFSEDGRTLRSRSEDGQTIAWDFDFASWRAHACTIAGCNLTHKEWRQYLSDEVYR